MNPKLLDLLNSIQEPVDPVTGLPVSPVTTPDVVAPKPIVAKQPVAPTVSPASVVVPPVVKEPTPVEEQAPETDYLGNLQAAIEQNKKANLIGGLADAASQIGAAIAGTKAQKIGEGARDIGKTALEGAESAQKGETSRINQELVKQNIATAQRKFQEDKDANDATSALSRANAEALKKAYGPILGNINLEKLSLNQQDKFIKDFLKRKDYESSTELKRAQIDSEKETKKGKELDFYQKSIQQAGKKPKEELDTISSTLNFIKDSYDPSTGQYKLGPTGTFLAQYGIITAADPHTGVKESELRAQAKQYGWSNSTIEALRRTLGDPNGSLPKEVIADIEKAIQMKRDSVLNTYHAATKAVRSNAVKSTGMKAVDVDPYYSDWQQMKARQLANDSNYIKKLMTDEKTKGDFEGMTPAQVSQMIRDNPDAIEED